MLSTAAKQGLGKKMSVVYEMPADEYNSKLADALKQIEEFNQPEWSFFIKSGVAKKRPPQEENFWYKRAASILRQIYINKIVGVNRLKTRYGGKQNRGAKPEKFKKGSGKIIRVILQQSEKAGLLERSTEGRRAGRRLTDKGKELLEGIK
jgi:small subunit ribosomal protein S19e